MAETKADFTDQYAGLMASTFGQDLMESLNKLHASLIDDAEKAKSQEQAYGLLKQASGVILALSHIKGKAVIPKARGEGNNN